MLLEVNGLCVNYGRIEAIRDITTLKTVSGLRPVRAGTVIFQGKDITHMPAHERPSLGISQSPEGRGIFPGMTVKENLDMGTYARADRKSPAIAEDRERVFTLFPRLKERVDQVVGSMSGGEQQMLAMGRALMARPKLLLLDEPSMGLAPKLIKQIFDIVTEINSQGTTVLLVEQNASQALKRAHRAYVLETGEIVREGAAADLAADPKVKAAYLGGDV